MGPDYRNTITRECEILFPNSSATFSSLFVSAVTPNIHCSPHKFRPSVNSPPKKSVDLSVVGSANCVACQTFSRALPRQKKKVPPDIAVNAKMPSGNFALILTTHFNAIMKGASHNERHVTIMGLTQPFHQEEVPPDIYVNADSFLKKFAMCPTAHFDVVMKGGALPKGRSQPRALHAGIHKTGPDMIGNDTCFGRKTESWGDAPTIHRNLPAHSTSTVALYSADDDFSFPRIWKYALELWNSGNRVDAFQKCRQTKYIAGPGSRFGWKYAARILEGGSYPLPAKMESFDRRLAILSSGLHGMMGRSSSRTGWSSCTWRPAAGTSTIIPKFSERE